ncbi:hypothetical protein PSN45_000881 [Yamadazyma tenuis]|uniref:DUF4536 domain-containing protein n=1 Tax=Candida tenuis (strain ATCC 10573 / BCRC 21748 / CBS 615 / JCM 9827 / NBRC 10315 / NRRL Y-1498 / VKM Y-70) TaxID=590646 RepID=G3BBC9_CANTC|nr:uncharacterized protein CANTEDRAFT_115625 [Yamadazyma tenuis ATCC 10573]EGV62155.1 hypothetical protein CANTEDRAFT_115625 [Yamadazyma tenuis ATCC 10573]WEJ93418.1 hypothetical protein PSN45_000881 [Yamadazyma tenuis]
MVESNILSIFKTSQAPTLIEEDCIPCTSMQSATALGMGGYLLTDRIYTEADGTIDGRKHPKWWRNSVKTSGVVLVMFGVQRLYRVYEIYQDQRPLQ